MVWGRDTGEIRWKLESGGQHLATAEPRLTADSCGLFLTQLTTLLCIAQGGVSESFTSPTSKQEE